MENKEKLKAALKYKQIRNKFTATLNADQFDAALNGLTEALRHKECKFTYTKFMLRFPGYNYKTQVKEVRWGHIHGYDKDGSPIVGRICCLYFNELCELWKAIEKEQEILDD